MSVWIIEKVWSCLIGSRQQQQLQLVDQRRNRPRLLSPPEKHCAHKNNNIIDFISTDQGFGVVWKLFFFSSLLLCVFFRFPLFTFWLFETWLNCSSLPSHRSLSLCRHVRSTRISHGCARILFSLVFFANFLQLGFLTLYRRQLAWWILACVRIVFDLFYTNSRFDDRESTAQTDNW